MIAGNLGTNVPQSYVGTVDAINIAEDSGYMPVSWLCRIASIARPIKGGTTSTTGVTFPT